MHTSVLVLLVASGVEVDQRPPPVPGFELSGLEVWVPGGTHTLTMTGC